MLTQKTAIEKVRRFVRQVNDSGLHLQGVVLYGSYAKNTQHKWSDIDVALVADNFKCIGFYDFDLFGKTLIQKPFFMISPRTYNTRDFNPDKDPFVEEILKDGIEIE